MPGFSLFQQLTKLFRNSLCFRQKLKPKDKQAFHLFLFPQSAVLVVRSLTTNRMANEVLINKHTHATPLCIRRQILNTRAALQGEGSMPEVNSPD